jgi:hypothetical protein
MRDLQTEELQLVYGGHHKWWHCPPGHKKKNKCKPKHKSKSKSKSKTKSKY